jgi:hypothetical protein
MLNNAVAVLRFLRGGAACPQDAPPLAAKPFLKPP